MEEQKRTEVYTKAHNLSMIAQESAVVSLLICISQQLEEVQNLLERGFGLVRPQVPLSTSGTVSPTPGSKFGP